MSWLQDDDDEEIIFTLDDLIEELIHALLGYTGEIFVDSSSVADDPRCASAHALSRRGRLHPCQPTN